MVYDSRTWTRSEERSDGPESEGQPGCFMQWKGTDVCMDVRCECGANAHIDGYFAYHFTCGYCGVTWRMPDQIRPVRAEDQTTRQTQVEGVEWEPPEDGYLDQDADRQAD